MNASINIFIYDKSRPKLNRNNKSNKAIPEKRCTKNRHTDGVVTACKTTTVKLAS